MTRTVYKYAIPSMDVFTIDLPMGAKLLSVQAQRGVPHLWALVDPDLPVEHRHFRLAGTGHGIVGGVEFVGTVQLYEGALVLHLFEVMPHDRDESQV